MAVANEHMKKCARWTVYPLAPHPKQRNQQKKKRRNQKKWDVLDWDNLLLHPGWLLGCKRKGAEDLLLKGKSCSNMTRATNGRILHLYNYRQFVHQTGTHLFVLVDMTICLSFFKCSVIIHICAHKHYPHLSSGPILLATRYQPILSHINIFEVCHASTRYKLTYH